MRRACVLKLSRPDARALAARWGRDGRILCGCTAWPCAVRTRRHTAAHRVPVPARESSMYWLATTIEGTPCAAGHRRQVQVARRRKASTTRESSEAEVNASKLSLPLRHRQRHLGSGSLLHTRVIDNRPRGRPTRYEVHTQNHELSAGRQIGYREGRPRTFDHAQSHSWDSCLPCPLQVPGRVVT